jgi:CPA2 family monovalent cation:H+ antiporter-2
MHDDLPLITIMAAAFAAAWVLGVITQRLRLSPIVGYLLAGVVVGPHATGIAGDPKHAAQLAEVGVILLMFGVGLHFHVRDLLAVRDVAVPGAVGQSVIATLLGIAVTAAVGWPVRSGLVLGMAVSVASTVVLVRVLSDNRMLDTTHGHVAVGWLVVEDVLTVIVLVLIPALGDAPAAAGAVHRSLWIALPWALLKLAALVAILGLAGPRVVPWIMVRVARLRSRELFTLTVLVTSIAVAAASAYAFGASLALGAFLAGMIVGRSPVSHQAAADALPLRDAFAVLFFASVGMLFDPHFLLRQPLFTLACLAIVMVGKPLAALGIVAVIGYPVRTALTVALGLAQIGEFSFILAELARHHGLLGEAGHNVLVACALISLSVNPLLFRLIGPIEAALRRRPKLWRLLSRRGDRRAADFNAKAVEALAKSDRRAAVIVGYGPAGRAVDGLLHGSEPDLDVVIVDLNMDTVQRLTAEGRIAIYGDAFNIEVLADALPRATHLIITLPHSFNRNPLIVAAKLINPAVKVFVRARYVAERSELTQAGADGACYEEAEAAVALARMVLSDRGAAKEAIGREVTRIRRELSGAEATG